MAQFEGYERREAKILETLKKYGISSIDECKEITVAKGIDVDQIVRSTQPICFENAIWAYTVGCAIAIKKGCVKAADAAADRQRDKNFAGNAAQNIGKNRAALHAGGDIIKNQLISPGRVVIAGHLDRVGHIL